MNNFGEEIYNSAGDYGNFRAFYNMMITILISILAIGFAIYLIKTKGNHSQETIGVIVKDSQCSIVDKRQICNTKYKYVVDKVTHTGFHTSGVVFPKGKVVKVLYDKDNHTDSVIFTKDRCYFAYGLIAFSCFSLYNSIFNFVSSKFFPIAASAHGIGSAVGIISNSIPNRH